MKSTGWNKKVKVVIITGTPGVGKTTIAKILAAKYNYSRFDLHKYYKIIAERYNQYKKCYDINYIKFCALIEAEKKKVEQNKKNKEIKGILIDSHVTHLLPAKMVDVCMVLTCSNLKLLRKRLRQRKYGARKIEENMESEIMQVCLQEARERHRHVFMFDTAVMSAEKIAREVGKCL